MTVSIQTETSVHLRWMTSRDMPEVYAIENANFEFPWSDADFTRCLRNRDCIVRVAECAEKVAGFIVYRLEKTRVHILSMAVHASLHRQGVGTAMINDLIAKLSANRRNNILCEVRERNRDAQLFFKASGFRAISVVPDFYEDTPEDAYLMQYRLSQ